ncbi:PREDICTED: PC-esterase domain-containing protein 1B-like [Hipposideros armiger]|uniref:PC-esterase domain-containing protein 1B-like n=1 Tax=Hipposideros armiger TaxID=186990 RepID=A0A8B7TFE0_HIPAR|nr:PREDICTED: PC-esterase domain-containing protein 1B-like [Hipposideros armiger]
MVHLRACEVRQLLHNKFVVVMGDSVQRAVYKDLVLLLQKDRLLSSSQLNAHGEPSFEQDVLLEGGRRRRTHHGSHYREVRQFCSGHHLVRFYFLTRVYSNYLAEILGELRRGEHPPDLVIMNSCIWDLARYGFHRGYRENLQRLFSLLDRVLPVSCLLVWNTAMPVAEVVSDSFLPAEHQLQCSRLWEDMLEANFYGAAEASRHGFDVLDLHFHFRHAEQHRQRDGVHWDERAHRHLSQLLLAHVADAWGVDLPRRHPAGRRVRDARARESRRPAEGRQPRDHRGDPDEQALPSSPPTSTSYRNSRRPSAPYPQDQPLCPNYRQGVHVPSHSPVQHRQFSRHSPPRHVRYREANVRTGPEPHPDSVRRPATQHRSRGNPPYPPRSPNRPRRHRRRHTDRQTHEWQGLRSQT